MLFLFDKKTRTWHFNVVVPKLKLDSSHKGQTLGALTIFNLQTSSGRVSRLTMAATASLDHQMFKG